MNYEFTTKDLEVLKKVTIMGIKIITEVRFLEDLADILTKINVKLKNETNKL
jgi:hypothetical protein